MLIVTAFLHDNLSTRYFMFTYCRRSMETKLLMHRHWSLLDAMVHAPEVMARLSTFSEGSHGLAMLYRILATTGIPVQQVRFLT